MSDQKKSLKELLRQALDLLVRLRRYSMIAFIVFISLIYGFLMLRINNLSSAEPTDTAITEQVKAAKVPRIDEDVVKQLQSLQDNSVNVQALFEEARSNPFCNQPKVCPTE